MKGPRDGPGGPPIRLDWRHRVRIAQQMASALLFLHNTRPQVGRPSILDPTYAASACMAHPLCLFGNCRWCSSQHPAPGVAQLNTMPNARLPVAVWIQCMFGCAAGALASTQNVCCRQLIFTLPS